jgi:hypothetical protein
MNLMDVSVKVLVMPNWPEPATTTEETLRRADLIGKFLEISRSVEQTLVDLIGLSKGFSGEK